MSEVVETSGGEEKETQAPAKLEKKGGWLFRKLVAPNIDPLVDQIQGKVTELLPTLLADLKREGDSFIDEKRKELFDMAELEASTFLDVSIKKIEDKIDNKLLEIEQKIDEQIEKEVKVKLLILAATMGAFILVGFVSLAIKSQAWEILGGLIALCGLGVAAGFWIARRGKKMPEVGTTERAERRGEGDPPAPVEENPSKAPASAESA